MKLLKQLQEKLFGVPLTPEQILHQRKTLIITGYQHATKAKVDGLLALEAEVYDYDKEKELLKRVYKKAISMLMYGETQENIEKYITYERTLLLTHSKKDISELQNLYLVGTIVSVLAQNDAGRYFSYMKKNAETGGFLDKKMIQEIENEILQKLIREKQEKGPYPILSHPQISELTELSADIFQNLRTLSNGSIQEFLRETSSHSIVLLLGISSKEDQEFLLSFCSQRLENMITEMMHLHFYSIPLLSSGTITEVNFDMIKENVLSLQELLVKIGLSTKNDIIEES